MIKHKRHYTRMTVEDFDKIRGMFAHSFSIQQIHEVTGRSTSTISYILAADSFDHYKEMFGNAKLRPSLKDIRANKTPVAVSNHMEDMEEKKVEGNRDLDEALESLDFLMEALKGAISDVAYFSAQQKVDEIIKDKNIEIQALQTVVDAAKKSNLAQTLKTRLMGGS